MKKPGQRTKLMSKVAQIVEFGLNLMDKQLKKHSYRKKMDGTKVR